MLLALISLFSFEWELIEKVLWQHFHLRSSYPLHFGNSQINGWLHRAMNSFILPPFHLGPCRSPLITSSWGTSSLATFFTYPVQFSSVTQSCLTLWDPMNRSPPDLPVHHQTRSLLKLMSIESVMPSNHLILCCPLLLPPVPSSIRVFSNESTLHMKWPKYWSFNFSISSSNEHPGLISFRMDWLDLLAVQGTLKNLLQHHSPKASIFQCSVFFTIQLSQPYMTTGKTVALTRWTCVGK